ncbi:hypothetical protein, partial [Bordetella bronchiseptica]|uniref:hypothetical protein n=1 Tax=Bordetella bronchiseptica TaxID=518 RepID=UPI001F4460E2
ASPAALPGGRGNATHPPWRDGRHFRASPAPVSRLASAPPPPIQISSFPIPFPVLLIDRLF